jgi:serine/threonine-protein kinase
MSESKHLGKYEIIEEIGRGGFGTVYKARDPDLGRTIALKVLAPHLTWDQQYVERFRLEARAVAQLRHPNIVVVHEIGEAEGQVYIAMEYLSGRTLQEMIADEGPFLLDRTVVILEQVADALDYAHKQGVLHRDVKPANIMVAEDGRVQLHTTLMDFGLVKAMKGSKNLTSKGVVLGTAEYMAPEQADPDLTSKIGPATDRYALGVVAYHMLTGQVPFSGPTTSVLYAHVHKEPPNPHTVREGLSEDVAQVLLKALAKPVKDRYNSAGEMVRALREAVAGEVAPSAASRQAQPLRPLTKGASTATGTAFPWKAVSIGLAVALVLGFVGGIAAVISGIKPQPQPAATPTTVAGDPLTPTPAPTKRPALTPTHSPAPTSTPIATSMPTATPTPGSTSTSVPTPTLPPPPTVTSTPLPSPTLEPTATPTPTVTSTPLPPPTLEPTATPTPRVLLVEDFDTHNASSIASEFKINRNAGNDGSLSLVGVPHVNRGRQALAFQFEIRNPPPKHYIGFDREFPHQDWSGLSMLCVWIESDGSERSLVLQFGETVSDFEKDTFPLSNGTGDYCLSLPQASRIDLRTIGYYGIYVEGPPEGQSTIYIDNIRVVE